MKEKLYYKNDAFQVETCGISKTDYENGDYWMPPSILTTVDFEQPEKRMPYAINAIKMYWDMPLFVDVFKAARDIAGMHDFTDKQIQNAVDLANA